MILSALKLVNQYFLISKNYYIFLFNIFNYIAEIFSPKTA